MDSLNGCLLQIMELATKFPSDVYLLEEFQYRAHISLAYFHSELLLYSQSKKHLEEAMKVINNNTTLFGQKIQLNFRISKIIILLTNGFFKKG